MLSPMPLYWVWILSKILSFSENALMFPFAKWNLRVFQGHWKEAALGGWSFLYTWQTEGSGETVNILFGSLLLLPTDIFDQWYHSFPLRSLAMSDLWPSSLLSLANLLVTSPQIHGCLATGLLQTCSSSWLLPKSSGISKSEYLTLRSIMISGFSLHYYRNFTPLHFNDTT